MDYCLGALYSRQDYISAFKVWVETTIDDDRVFDVRFIYPKYMRFLSDGRYNNAPAVETPHRNGTPYSSIVTPTQSQWEGDEKLVWHRNGLAVPPDAYKSISQEDNDW